MDKIWYRNPSKSEVIGRCGEDEKTEWPCRTDKSQTLKKTKNKKLKTVKVVCDTTFNYSPDFSSIPTVQI